MFKALLSIWSLHLSLCSTLKPVLTEFLNHRPNIWDWYSYRSMLSICPLVYLSVHIVWTYLVLWNFWAFFVTPSLVLFLTCVWEILPILYLAYPWKNLACSCRILHPYSFLYNQCECVNSIVPVSLGFVELSPFLLCRLGRPYEYNAFCLNRSDVCWKVFCTS